MTTKTHAAAPWNAEKPLTHTADYRVFSAPDSDGYRTLVCRVSKGDLANGAMIVAAPEAVRLLAFAADRVALANAEGQPILSAWLPEARACIAAATTPLSGHHEGARAAASYDDMRWAAPDMLTALKAFADEFGAAMESDDHISGADAVDAICRLWPKIRAAIAKAEGKEG